MPVSTNSREPPWGLWFSACPICCWGVTDPSQALKPSYTVGNLNAVAVLISLEFTEMPGSPAVGQSH